jgi:hypothetical protein
MRFEFHVGKKIKQFMFSIARKTLIPLLFNPRIRVVPLSTRFSTRWYAKGKKNAKKSEELDDCEELEEEILEVGPKKSKKNDAVIDSPYLIRGSTKFAYSTFDFGALDEVFSEIEEKLKTALEKFVIARATPSRMIFRKLFRFT